MENLQHPFLHLAIQIDQQVAAADEVEPGERRIAGQVVRREQHRLAQLLLDAIEVLFLEEEFTQALRRYVKADGRGITALASVGNHTLVDVGGENLNGRSFREMLGVFS